MLIGNCGLNKANITFDLLKAEIYFYLKITKKKQEQG